MSHCYECGTPAFELSNRSRCVHCEALNAKVNRAENDMLRGTLVGLIEAAQAVIARWDSPKWKDQPHTAEVICRLRDVVNATKADLT